MKEVNAVDILGGTLGDVIEKHLKFLHTLTPEFLEWNRQFNGWLLTEGRKYIGNKKLFNKKEKEFLKIYPKPKMYKDKDLL